MALLHCVDSLCPYQRLTDLRLFRYLARLMEVMQMKIYDFSVILI